MEPVLNFHLQVILWLFCLIKGSYSNSEMLYLCVFTGRPRPDTMGVRASQPLPTLQSNKEDFTAGSNVWSFPSIFLLLRLQNR